MEPLILAWMFDSRWALTFRNPCQEFLMIMPVVAELATLGMMVYEHSIAKMDTDAYFVILSSAYLTLAALCLFLMMRVYNRAEGKLAGARENYEAIRDFTHSFEVKKAVWSWVGLSIIVVSILQIVFNSLYVHANNQYGYYSNWTRFYMDVVAWSYLGAVFALFLIFKLGFLLLAWKNPQRYLQYKSII